MQFEGSKPEPKNIHFGSKTEQIQNNKTLIYQTRNVSNKSRRHQIFTSKITDIKHLRITYPTKYDSKFVNNKFWLK